MRIFDPIVRVGIGACALLCVGIASAHAFDVRERPTPAPSLGGAVGPSFKSVPDALRAGLQGLSSGDTTSAVQALQFAATNGNIAAQWKLGRMYSDEASTLRDDYKAFQYFSQIADQNAEENPDSPHARLVSQAFVALGTYYLEGIPQSPVKRDAARAKEMFHYAASYFGDADAQYSLARLYLDVKGPQRNPAHAARWLNLAAEKGHTASQAVLGHLLFNGDGIQRQPARGLMWISLAKAKAEGARDAWIVELWTGAAARASEDERRLAAALTARALRQP